MESEKIVNVIGAGLAGVEAAYQLAKNNIKVKLYEMRPVKMTPAHHTSSFAELVCSNSLRGDNFNNAVGVLKNEIFKDGKYYDEIIMSIEKIVFLLVEHLQWIVKSFLRMLQSL